MNTLIKEYNTTTAIIPGFQIKEDNLNRTPVAVVGVPQSALPKHIERARKYANGFLATPLLIGIAREFCHRVEIGEVWSRRTYAQMKEALAIVDQET